MSTMSDPRKALVTGATGFLGRAVVRAFESAKWSVQGTGLTRASPPNTMKVDLTNATEIEKAIDNVKPSVVVHCAADRSPDSCSANPEAARALNVTSTSTIASVTTKRGILLIYISTDYVFPGTEGDAPYSATHSPNPTNIYGQLKLDGERAALSTASASNAEGSVLVLRVPVLYGDVEPAGNNKESAVNVLLDIVYKAAETGAEVPIAMDDWALRYPTNTLDVGRVCKDIAEKYVSQDVESRKSLPQILQFSSEDRFTKYEICQLLAEVLGVSIADGMQPNKQGNEPGKAIRPYDAHLSSRELQDLGIDISTMDFKGWWRWHLRAYRK